MVQLAAWESKWGMAFHPDKCSFMRISRSRSPIQFKYHLKNVELQVVDSSKYLGVDISSTLSWNQHIDRTVKKANGMLGFLQRNLRISKRETKSSAYFVLVRPNLEYCSTVWSPHIKTGQHKVEMVQRRAARYVTSRYRNTSSVTDMLEEREWESLESRRVKARVTMLYNIIQDLIDIPASKYLTPATSRTRALHSQKLRQFSACTESFRKSFFPDAVTPWNLLPATVAEAPDLVFFKRGLASLRF